MSFKEVLPKDLTENPIKIIGLDWMLVAAGSKDKYNMMTASWGGFGVLWHKPVCFVFVRPSRYTYEFIENEVTFSLTFFGKEHKPTLNFMGSKSGRDVNKMQEDKLTPIEAEGTVYFKEANLVLLCKKLYTHDLNPEHFLSASISEKFYKKDNYHRMYIAEIIACYKK